MMLTILLILSSAVLLCISETQFLEFQHEFAKITYSNPDVIGAKGVFFKLNRTQGAFNLTVTVKNTYSTVPVSKQDFTGKLLI